IDVKTEAVISGRVGGRARALGTGLLLAAASLSMGIITPAPAAAALPGASGLIAWQRNDASGSQIWVMNPDGTNKHQLTSTGSNYMPSWSPDGTQIVFESDRGGGPSGDSDIYLMNADGSNQHAITTGGETNWPRWSPDGTKIVSVTSFRTGMSGSWAPMAAIQ